MEEFVPSSLSQFWESYNAPDSLLSLVIPSVLWSVCWIYYKFIAQKEFARWYALHTLHHLGAIGFGLASLFLDDDTKFNERNGIFWSLPYFVIDILDCTLMNHWTYILHGLICFGLGMCNYNIPLLRELRMNSRASFIESSSIILYQVKQNRNPVLFVVFAIVYTLCRLVWIPIGIMQPLLEHGVQWTDWIFLVLLVFYGLQIHWWIKIINIIIKGDGKSKKAGEEETKKEE